jgi:hypothetical protein
MSTTHTPGPWHADKLPSGDYRIIYNATRNWLAKVYCDGESEAAKADAALIAEAGTILHETGLTPRQLAERCKELEGVLTFVQSDPCFPLLGSVTKDDVHAALSKAQKGGV